MPKTTKATGEKASKTTTKPAAKAVDPLLKQLLESGAHFGHRKDRWNPKMRPFIYGVRGGVHIIDLTKSLEQLKAAEQFIESATKAGGSVLFVGTKRQARPIIEKAAGDAGMPYVSNRWLGGMLTNLETIQTRITKLKKLQSDSQEGKLTGTKKEKAEKEREMQQLDKIFAGISQMQTLPSAVFVVDILVDDIAVSEASKLGIPVVAICDSNTDPEKVTYPIASNDDAIKAISMITQIIGDAAKRGSELYRAKTAESAAKEAAKNNQEDK